MEHPDETFVLLKFGQTSHLKALRERGLVYLKTLDYFRKVEAELDAEDDGRGDKFEGSSYIWQPRAVEITFTVPELLSYKTQAGDLTGPAACYPDNFCALNVFCLTAVEIPTAEGNISVDERAIRLGESAIMIDPPPFSERLQRAARSAGYSLSFGFVEYRDYMLHTGSTGPLMKPGRFDYQREFRFVVDRGTEICNDLTLTIGSIEDISSAIVPARTVNEFKREPQV